MLFSRDKTPLDTPAAIEKESPVIEMVRPDVLIGISSKNGKPTAAEDADLRNRFAMSVSQRCELCGASLTAEMVHPVKIARGLYNACGMCFCAMNLDRIPHYQRGAIIYFPNLNQTRLNALLRAMWSVDLMLEMDPRNQDLIQLHEVMNEMSVVFDGQVMLTNGNMGSSNTEVYASMMHLLRDEEYEQRYKLFKNFRWLPDRVIFEDEIAYWAQTDSHHLHPEKMSGNITQFMSKYVPDFSLKK